MYLFLGDFRESLDLTNSVLWCHKSTAGKLLFLVIRVCLSSCQQGHSRMVTGYHCEHFSIDHVKMSINFGPNPHYWPKLC